MRCAPGGFPVGTRPTDGRARRRMLSYADRWVWDFWFALGPGPPGTWDDLATWTGSVIGHDGRWWMCYTGISTREDGRVQRVGVAGSSVTPALTTW